MEELEYAIRVEGVVNPEFQATLRMWVVEWPSDHDEVWDWEGLGVRHSFRLPAKTFVDTSWLT